MQAGQKETASKIPNDLVQIDGRTVISELWYQKTLITDTE